jgi:hypothetical protein
MPLVDTVRLNSVLWFMRATNALSLITFLAGAVLTPIGVTVPLWWLLATFGTTVVLSLASLVAFSLARRRGARVSVYYALLPVLFILIFLVVVG